MNLSIPSEDERKKLLDAVDTVFKHGMLVLGPEVEELETKIASFCGRKFGIGVNSGTDALFLGLKSLGIGPGDEVITTSLSWIATANAIALTGAIPIFADVQDDLNIDAQSVERLITDNTKALLPVHFNGKVCEMDELTAIAEKHNLKLIEDAAQAFSARYKDRLAGSFGDIACFSMNPMKIFAGLGEAGMILTDSVEIKDRLLSLRYAGTVDREICVEPGYNSRLDTIQAAMLLKRFGRLDKLIKKRREIANIYNKKLHDFALTPVNSESDGHVYYAYTIIADDRDSLKEFLESEGIETKIRHPVLMPQQPAYKENARGEFSNAERVVAKILSLPIGEHLDRDDIDFVCSSISDFYQKYSN
ncbi:MAG: DegT/DnrJ/EryC1/StrS family aminotransferase [Candidatus Marinimicrobia bacterium]|nr:DegT/DnrJ/EryC1/StrS family aminotransferase [Candidatus Neomarinimicrobiota bacterium]